jgi:hypothetical protein
MLWLVVAAGGVGFVLGLCLFRLPAIVAASASLFFVCIGTALFAQWELLASIGLAFVVVTILQCGYLAGLSVSWAWSRARARHTILRSSHIDQWRT